MASNFQDFVPQLNVQDIKKRILLGSEIIQYLENPLNSIDYEELPHFIDSIALWLNHSNFKVVQNGLDIVDNLVGRMKENFKPYISTVLPAIVDRMGDSKDQVREGATALTLKLMSSSASPQFIYDKLMTAFAHKNWRVREQVLILLEDTLDSYGSASLAIARLMPGIVKLLADPNAQVRDASMSALVNIYKHVGEKVRSDLTKRHKVAPAKLKVLFEKFDDMQSSGQMLASPEGYREDDVDSRSQHSESSEIQGATSKACPKRASSAPPARRNMFSTSKPSATASLHRRNIMRASSTNAGNAGAADEEMFINAFEDVPKVQLFSAKDLEHELAKIRETLSDVNNDWDKRNNTMKRLRGLLVAGAADYEEFYQHLRSLEGPFQIAIKDLRSQVVREAAITIAYLSQQLGIRLDHFAEVLLPNLINLIPNSAKIMSTSGIVAVHFIIQYTHVSRLIPIITSNLSSKSKEIRKTCCEFLDQLLHTWPTHPLEKHAPLLQEAIRKGISDADPEARACARKAFWGFADHFRDQANLLLSSLDSSKQRMLQGELSMSNSSSSNSLTSTTKSLRPTSTASHGGSVENLSGRRDSISRRSGIPVRNHSSAESATVAMNVRSNSAIDLAAVRRAKARTSFATAANLSRGSGASLPRTGARISDTFNAVTSPERTVRPRSKGASQSQPSSRPDSPSSRLNYATYSKIDGVTKHRSLIPTAGGKSRETSPSRMGYNVLERRPSRTRSLLGAGEKYQSNITPSGPLMAEKILQQSREAEAAVAEALIDFLSQQKTPVRRRYNAFEDQSDESETSSVCSDRSLGSYGRSIDDISEVIHNLQSIHWSDKKEGLLALQALFRSSRYLSPVELRKVTEIFAKHLMDPYNKVFTLFLDTLNELIIQHKSDLHGWLYILLTRLLLKMGNDARGSVQSKIQRTLDLVRESFPAEEQFNAIVHFLNDQTQTPNTKVKVALLHYLHSLIEVMDPSDFTTTNTEVKMAVMKVISWTPGPKSNELRKHAEDVLVALFSLNAPEFSQLLSQLPKPYQDSAFQLLHSQLRRYSTDLTPNTRYQKSCPVMSHLQSSNATLPRIRSYSQNRSFEDDETENLNPEDVHNSLRKTSAEIQEYNFDRLEQDLYEKNTKKGLTDSPSHDSSLSQNAQDSRLHTLEERLEFGSSTDSSPTKRSPMDYIPTLESETDGNNGYDGNSLTNTLTPNNDLREGGNLFTSILFDLNNRNTDTDQKQDALKELISLTDEGSSLSEEDFRNILKVVIEAVWDNDVGVRFHALKALCELIKKQSQNFHGYVELILLKIIEATKADFSCLHKAAVICGEAAVEFLPPEQCVRTLMSIILTSSEYSDIQIAIKMLKTLVECHPKNVILQLLPDIMPGLIKAYDHVESLVRKAAVFCMVAVHVSVGGDAIKPYIATLNNSKMKLLNLYIRRAQTSNNGGSTPGSPGNPPSSSSSH